MLVGVSIMVFLIVAGRGRGVGGGGGGEGPGGVVVVGGVGGTRLGSPQEAETQW